MLAADAAPFAGSGGVGVRWWWWWLGVDDDGDGPSSAARVPAHDSPGHQPSYRG